MTKQEKIDKYLVQVMQDDPLKMLQWMLVMYGREMLAVNAETMNISQECTLKGKRYRIKCRAIITEISK